jgi:hypothetical protein
MKKLLLFAAVLVSGFAAMAQQKADDVIKLNTDKYDFGKIKQGVPASTYFTITNISDKPVVIENSWAGCGCTTPEWSKEPIAPKSTAKIKVGYNAAQAAPFTKEVYVKLAGIQEPKILRITGEVLDANAYEAYTKTDEYKARSIEEAKAAKETAKEAKKAAKKA